MYTIENSTILVVDDNPTNLEVLSETLMETGFEVSIATNGEGAIEQVEYMPPDLILLDIQMPGIDGFETCRRLKKNPLTNDIPIIFMTALSDIEDKLKGLSLGAVDYITKPFQQEEVLARLRIHLRLRYMSKVLASQNNQLHHLTQNLEEKVAERTADLQRAQVQLVQREKLSALGELVAGVAHEINNPVSCISSNLPIAKQYVEDITGVLKLYQKHYPVPHPEIETEIDTVDLEFLLKDLPKILLSMEAGSDRICEISAALRSFSRSDQTGCTVSNLHEGLDSTLMVLHHRLKACGDRPAIQIIKNYQDIPPIECYPGQLNQVFMNILSNAIEALEEYHTQQPPGFVPTIKIETTLTKSQSIEIRISDNGPGMSNAIQDSLFNPFFTTKSVGKGTGLGMSISRQIIVEKHNGRLRCVSVPGKGAEFILELPIHQLCAR